MINPRFSDAKPSNLDCLIGQRPSRLRALVGWEPYHPFRPSTSRPSQRSDDNAKDATGAMELSRILARWRQNHTRNGIIKDPGGREPGPLGLKLWQVAATEAVFPR